MKKLMGSTLLLSTMVLLSVFGVACDTGGVKPFDSGTLSGVVHEEGTGTPLSEVTVALNSLQTTTDQNGRFAFREVPLGAGTLQVSMPGFDTYTKQIEVLAGDNSLDISLVRRFDPHLQFDHANTLVNDLEEGAMFYKNILGLNELESPLGPNSSVRVFSIGENQQLHAVQELGFEPTTGAKHNHVAFSVQDFDAFLSFLRGEGIEYGPFASLSGGFQTRPDGVRQIYFQDPFGNWIEVNDAQSDFQTFNSNYDHQGIYVSNLEGSGMFYRNILRLKEIISPWNDTAVTRFFSLGNNGELHLVPADASDVVIKKNKREHMTFNIKFFDAYLSFLTSKGIEYGNFAGDVGQIDTRPDGVRQIYFQDPDENWIEINSAQY